MLAAPTQWNLHPPVFVAVSTAMLDINSINGTHG
jgi:hypothetical protein